MTIFTHAGVFHADDAMACAIARQVIKKILNYPFAGIERVRELPDSFDPQFQLAVDIGGKHSRKKMIFDHHFDGGSADGMAATGKIWAAFGGDLSGGGDIAARVYEVLLGSIDRADIAISDWAPISDEMRHLSAAGFISAMNPPVGALPEEQMRCFMAAVDAAEIALKGAVSQAKAWVTMRNVVVEAAESRPRPEVMILETAGPWQEHVFELGLEDVLYVVFPDVSRGGYRIQCVPDQPGSFGMRKPLPEAWKGLRGSDLSTALGGGFTVDTSLFCHPGLFMAGCASLEEALAMANLALE